MKVAISTIAYQEPRLIRPFLAHFLPKVDEILVLNSTKPWKGSAEGKDETGDIAEEMGATVLRYDWETEEEQRNAGQDYLSDYDWILILDPDEALDNLSFDMLIEFLGRADKDAYVTQHQRVFWKDKEVSPHTDYLQIIAVKPSVRFTENRVVDADWGIAPVDLFHFSWARTDEEVLSKIQHYSHADELIPDWYEKVWKGNKTTNLHPKTPSTLSALIDADIPKELKGWKL